MKEFKIVLIISLLMLCISLGVYATNSDNDPIITLSYFEKKIGEFKDEMVKIIDEKTRNQDETPENVESIKYEIINVEKGKKVIFNESTEFILRRGTASIIDPSGSNGIPNLTTGKDDKNGETAGLQKLYLVPRSDGRGILAKSDLIIMVRGRYTIK